MSEPQWPPFIDLRRLLTVNRLVLARCKSPSDTWTLRAALRNAVPFRQRQYLPHKSSLLSPA